MKKLVALMLALLLAMQSFAAASAAAFNENIYYWAKGFNVTTIEQIEKFRPNDNISREEVAALMTRAIEKGLFPAKIATAKEIPFVDKAQIAPEFQNAVQMVQNSGIFQGNNHYFNPKNSLTELEAIAILVRASREDVDDLNTKTNPWYQEYLNIAKKFDVVPANLNAPITRDKFFTWMKQFVENTTVKTVLEGKWMLKNVELEKGKPTELKDVTLTFTGHKVHAKICNNINGEFTLTPDTMKTTDLISTLMACQDEKIMSAEKNFELNNAKFMLSDDEKTLEITTARGIKYTFQKA